MRERMQERLQRLQAYRQQQQLDAILIKDRYNVRYFSGFTGDTAYLYISKEHRILLTDSRYTTWAQSQAEEFEIFEVNAQTGYAKKLQQLVEEEHIERIGFEDSKMIYAEVVRLQEEMEEQVAWCPVSAGIDALRQIKDAQELECIAKAEAIGDKAFSHILDVLCEGITEQEAAWELEMAMHKEGADGLSFETIAVFGERTAMPHAVPGQRRLQRGEFVVMDFGCTYEGYCSDMTRTVVLGRADAQQKKIYNTVLQAQQTALQYIRSGVKCKDVDAVARKVIADAGYGSYFGHGLGHSVGLFIHESPACNTRDETILQTNMLQTVEPGIYIPDFGGVRIEDLVVIQPDGCRNLTSSPKQLIELGGD